MEYYKRSKIENSVDLISSNLKKGNDVMIITFMSTVNRYRKYGHALLVSEIMLGKKTELIVGDPDFFSPKFYKVPLNNLLKGMSAKIGKVERGIYIFS